MRCESLGRNIRLYPWYVALTSAYFWLPTFFLFFNSQVSVEEVLRLEGIYYLFVVLLEVPSGYFSDRCGRKVTLVLSSLFFILSYGLFFTSNSFLSFAIAQSLLAAGIAFNSGTDTSLHYDSLVELQNEGSYGDREAIAAHWSFIAGGIAALVGGGVGMLDLRFPYLLSFCGACLLLAITSQFTEPATTRKAESALLSQIFVCLSYLRNRTIRWLFGFSVLMVVLNHVPYEFYQPYLRELGGEAWFSVNAVSAVSGFHTFIVMLLGAFAAKYSIRLKESFSLSKVLAASGMIQLLIIGAMAYVLHPLVAVLALFRSIPRAVMTAPLNEAISPLVKADHRATYLSIQSLVGRLLFSTSLFMAASTYSLSESTWVEMRSSLFAYAGLGLVALSVIVFAMFSLEGLREES